MPLWGSRQFPGTANNKPIRGFPPSYVAANVDPTSGIVREVAPGAAGQALANNLIGVTNSGMANTLGQFAGVGGPQHAGWNTVQTGRGWIRDVDRILVAGNNIALNAYAVIRGGNGSGANIQVTGVNGNGVVGNVTSLAVRAIGNGYNSLASGINVSIIPSVVLASGNAYATVLMGGRAGRTVFETIVAMGSMTGTDPVANNFFVNNA